MDKKQKILLIKLSSLGDVIFNIPLANCIKDAGYELTWLVSEKGFEVLKNNSCVDKIILAPFGNWKKEKNFIKIIKEFFNIVREINNQDFDIIIDTQGRLKSFLFTMFSSSKRKIGGSDGKEFSKFGVKEIVEQNKDWSINVVDKYLSYAKYLNIPTGGARMTLPETLPETKEKVNKLLESASPDKKIITLCPETTWTTKHWDKESWRELVNRLEGRFNLILTGTNYDYIEYINQGKGINLAGKTELMDLTEIFRRSDLVISLDSGSTHLARAANSKSIISIFCSTPKTYYEPLGEKYISFSGNLSCQPCHKRKCPLKTDECTKHPTANEVVSAVEKLV